MLRMRHGDWVLMNSKQLPPNTLPAGKDQSDTFNVFVGRLERDGEYLVGKVHNGKRYFGYRGEERTVTTEIFHVLSVAPDATVEWVDAEAEGNDAVPDGAVIGGMLEGDTQYVGRGIIQNQLTPGMFVQRKRIFMALYGGQVHQTNQYEMLVIKS